VVDELLFLTDSGAVAGEGSDLVVDTEVVEDADEYVKKTSNSEDKSILKVCHMNIRSLKKNHDELIIFLETLKVKNLNVIILSEVWTVERGGLQIPGYVMYYDGASFNKNDGLVVYIKEELRHQVHHIKQSYFTFTELEVYVAGLALGILSIYRPPSTNINDFLINLTNELESIKKLDLNIFVGDININLAEKSNVTLEYLNTLNSFGYLQYVNKPTRVANDSQTCIDHIFVRNHKHRSKINCKAFIIQTDITDHYTLILNIENNHKIKKNYTKLPLTYTQTDYNKLTILIENRNWQNILNCNDPENATQTFVGDLTDYIKRCQIIKTSQRKITKLKPWITVGLITSMRERDKLKKRYMRNKDDEGLERRYKNYRNTLTNLIKSTKHDYYKNKIDEAGKDTRKIWEVINEVTDSKTKKTNLVDVSIKIKDSHITEARDKANAFNEYFTNITDELLPKNSVATTLELETVSDSLFLNPVDDNELIKHICTLKTNGTPGKDSISAKVIKENHLNLLSPLKHIINLIFLTGKIPGCLKTSTITPIHKSGDVENIENYRPISLISNIAKILEKCIKKRLISYLDKNQLLHNKQYGFRQRVSTKDAVLDLIKSINNSLNAKRKCMSIFLDLTKAFDMVPHDRLLLKLEKIGCRGIVLELFKNYLTNREQQVKIGDTLSEALVIKRGIPQGTVLGPVLFLIYVNDMSRIIKDGQIISYADDTVLVFEGERWDTTIEKGRTGMKRVCEWLNLNGLLLNEKKTKYIKFGLNNTDSSATSQIEFNVNQEQDVVKIDEIKEIKYLGVQIDSGLKWSAHTNSLAKKLKSLIYKFYILRNIVNQELLKAIYYALVESHLRYCNIVWGSLHDEHLKTLNIVQKFIIKVMFNFPRLYPTKELFTETKLLNIRGLYILDTLIYVHFNKNNAFAFIEHPHYTRANQSNQLTFPKHNFTGTQRFITFFGPKLYNALPLVLRNIGSIDTFKTKVKTYVKQNYSLLERVLHIASYR